jgi:MarR family transcriptional regulator, lower aerobic nicotinate degradation pathway regulator
MYDIENSIGFLLAKAYQKGFACFREPLLKYNITPPQFSVLAFLWKEDGLSQAELSEKSQIDRTTMVGLIDRLADEGLVERKPVENDRRAYSIQLTKKGRSLEGELCEIADDIIRQFTSPLTEKEKLELARLLDKIRR